MYSNDYILKIMELMGTYDVIQYCNQDDRHLEYDPK